MWQDSRGGRMGVYMPSVDLTYDSLPRLTGNGFVEFGISGSILTSTALPVNTAGKPCAVALISPESFGAIVPVTGVTVTPATLSLAVGGNQALTAAVVPSTASQNVMWSSSNPSIATVDESGNVTAVAAGTANIIASSATSMSAQGECRAAVVSAAPEDFDAVYERYIQEILDAGAAEMIEGFRAAYLDGNYRGTFPGNL